MKARNKKILIAVICVGAAALAGTGIWYGVKKMDQTKVDVVYDSFSGGDPVIGFPGIIGRTDHVISAYKFRVLLSRPLEGTGNFVFRHSNTSNQFSILEPKELCTKI